MNKLITLLTLVLLPLSGIKGSIKTEKEIPTKVRQLTERIRQQYIPDSRLELFNIKYELSGKTLKISGVTTSRQAKSALIEALKTNDYQIKDLLKVLPDEKALNGKIYGIINLSVCNMRTFPYFTAPMTTQALLGMPVKFLEKDGWYRIQTPDKYIAWVHRDAVYPTSKEELHHWNQAKKIVVTASYGIAYSHPDEQSLPISDLVAGNRLKEEGQSGSFYKVSFPDGRIGFISKTIAMQEKEWRTKLKNDAGSILHTAYSFMGIPYLWAGLSTKAVDCSGFICNVFLQHDVIIPRDADQQAYAGKRIVIDTDFGNLYPGDLLLFGSEATAEQKERIDHVAFYLGEKRFLHSQGYVHISSFDPDDPLFDQFNLERLLFASRIIPYINKRVELTTTDRQEYYLW